LLKGWREIPIGTACWILSTEYKTGGWATFKPVHHKEKCTKCGLCWVFCPDGAIKWDGEGYPEVDYDYCKGCGICARECPTKAIEMVKR